MLALLLACHPVERPSSLESDADTDADSDADSDTDADTDADTGTPVPPPGTYVDCSAPKKGDGSYETPTNDLSTLSSLSFVGGDHVYFARGSTCLGTWTPHGSGTAAAPIVVAPYGDGDAPVIDATGLPLAIDFDGVQGWELYGLDLTGGNEEVVRVHGDGKSVLSHFVFSDLHVHDAPVPDGSAALFVYNGNLGVDDVRFDSIDGHDIDGGDVIYASASHIQLIDSTLYSAGGSGAWFGPAEYVNIENNVVHDVGDVGSGIIGLWTWSCKHCRMADNEVYNTTSANGGDGGAFDVDYYSADTIVEDNYGHDTDGYCVSVFGAGNSRASASATFHTVIRYNVCANNSLGPEHNPDFTPEGTFFLATWNGGSIDDVQIYGNTVYADPKGDVPVLHEADWTDSTLYSGKGHAVFRNNLVVSTTGRMVATTPGSPFQLDHNLYWSLGADPSFSAEGQPAVGLAAWQSKRDLGSIDLDPLLSPGDKGVLQFAPQPGSPAIGAGIDPCTGIPDCVAPTVDVLGNPVTDPPDIGAIQAAVPPTSLVVFLGDDRESKSQRVVLASFERQHPTVPVRAGTPDERTAWSVGTPAMVALDGRGKPIATWRGYTPAAVLLPRFGR